VGVLDFYYDALLLARGANRDNGAVTSELDGVAEQLPEDVPADKHGLPMRTVA